MIKQHGHVEIVLGFQENTQKFIFVTTILKMTLENQYKSFENCSWYHTIQVNFLCVCDKNCLEDKQSYAILDSCPTEFFSFSRKLNHILEYCKAISKLPVYKYIVDKTSTIRIGSVNNFEEVSKNVVSNIWPFFTSHSYELKHMCAQMVGQYIYFPLQQK